MRNGKAHTFIGVDGEGFGNADEHLYTLLGCGDRQTENPNGLSWESCLDFLYDRYLEAPSAIYVGFFLRYDFAHILRSMPEERVRMLLTKNGIESRRRKESGGNPIPFAVYLEGARKWQIDTLALKRIKFRPQCHPSCVKDYTHNEWMYVCDAGPFFQCSLLKAIDPREWPTDPVVTQEEYDLLAQGKERRDHAVLDEETRMYNRLENDVLSRLMTRLDQGLVSAKVRLSKQNFYGPGAAAGKWLAQNGQPTGEAIQDATPKKVWNAAVESYYGGWFEIMAHGHVDGPVYEYDINSAYPHVMASMPCLLHGEWTHGKGTPPDTGLCLVRTEVRGSDRYIGAMLHRVCSGGIIRPHVTAGTFWSHELRAAERAGLIDGYGRKREWWHYGNCGCNPPLAGVRELYEERLRVGKNTPYGKALKLIYNSMYGKLAQSVGAAKFANPLYGSLITSGCRTQILDAIATHPKGTESCVMVATDGVYFLDEHPTLSRSDKLGDWEMAVKNGLTLFKPGVYWDDNVREKGEVKLKSRGVNSRVFASYIPALDEAFAQWTDEATDWPEVEMSIPFSFVSPQQALQRNDWSQCGRLVLGRPNRQKSMPIKRRQVARKDGRVYRTVPRRLPGWCHCAKDLKQHWSHPYEKRFGEREWEDLQEYTRDGTWNMAMGIVE